MKFFELLSPDELTLLHEHALAVLDQVGCVIDHETALADLESAGASVDFATRRVRFNEPMVTRALQTVPKGYLAAGRGDNQGYDVSAGMEARFRCLGGALNWLSDVAAENHPIGLADAKRMLTLADALPQIDLVGTPFAMEFPSPTYDIHSLRLTLSNTQKHIWGLTLSARNLRYQMELLATAAGGRQQLIAQKRLSGIVCIIDPLRFPHDEIERLMVYGDYQVPIKWTSSSMIGGNAPFTLANALVQNIAQFLAAVVITETLRPGTPVVYYITLQAMDMRSGAALFGSPELMLARAAIAQIARQYDLPSSITTANSNGPESEQAIFMRSLGIFNCMLSGASEINLVGSLDGGAFFCPEFAVFDDECIAYLRRFRGGISLDGDCLSVEAIARGIQSGEYLSDAHTLAHLRSEKRHRSELLDWRGQELWAADGARTLMQRAWDKANRIIAQHEVPPLEDKLEAELDRIVAAADKQLLP